MTKGIRQFQLVQHKGKPIAARFLTVNTEVYSTLNATSILLYLKQGQLKLHNDKLEKTYNAGEVILLLEFSDFKAQRILSTDTQIFEALVFVLSELRIDSRQKEIKSNATLDIPLKIKSKPFLGYYNQLSQQFLKTEHLNSEYVESLKNKVLNTIPASSRKSIEDHLSSEKHRLMCFLFKEITTNVSLKELANSYGTSESTFYRVFVKNMGISPHQWIKDQRLHYARCEMQFQQKKASEMYLELGFEDLAHFSKEFKKKFGYNPSDTYENAQIAILGS